MMLTAQDCLELGIADLVVPEPEGGSHLNLNEAASILQASMQMQLAELGKLSQGKLLRQRYRKFRRMGETSNYSNEAMTREVELLMNISGAVQRKRASTGGRPRQSTPTNEEELTETTRCNLRLT